MKVGRGQSVCPCSSYLIKIIKPQLFPVPGTGVMAWYKQHMVAGQRTDVRQKCAVVFSDIDLHPVF